MKCHQTKSRQSLWLIKILANYSQLELAQFCVAASKPGKHAQEELGSIGGKTKWCEICQPITKSNDVKP